MIAELLTSTYPWRRWDFGLDEPPIPYGATMRNWCFRRPEEWAWRHIVKTVLTGGGNEQSAFEAIAQMFPKWPTAYELAQASADDIAQVLKSRRVSRPKQKAQWVQKLSGIVARGGVPCTRESLEALPGVGRHIASIILATVFGESEFGVDIHVERISKRLGLVSSRAKHREIEKTLKGLCPPEKLGHFSRSFVDFGQTVCRFYTRCHVCSLRGSCQAYSDPRRKRVADAVQRLLDRRPGREWQRYGMWRIYYGAKTDFVALNDGKFGPDFPQDKNLRDQALLAIAAVRDLYGASTNLMGWAKSA